MRARMQNHLGRLLVLVCLALTGCASTGAPEDWLPVAAMAPRDPYGAWITIEFNKEYDLENLAGEFLAVDADSLFVMTPYYGMGDPVIGVSRATIKKGRIASFDPETNKAAGWVAMGSITTLSHGLGAAVTLPLWVILGSAMAAGHSHTPLENYPDQPWDHLKMYARFPQGPPPGMRRLDLQPKKAWAPAPAPESRHSDTVF